MSGNLPAFLSDEQKDRLRAYEKLLWEKNTRVNLIARTTDPGTIRERHILHSLILAQRPFPPGCTVVDFGTGGGLPGIPLAIAFPDVQFVLVDSTGKKIDAVADMAAQLGMTNVSAWWGRAEAMPGDAHYAVSRATAPLVDLWRWFSRVRVALDDGPVSAWEPGLICLKGGDLREELAKLRGREPHLRVTVEPIGAAGDFFEGKAVVHVRSR
jgi:16S rRNA (guanine527-N7)-methyltransferase